MKTLELQTWTDKFSPEEINIDKIQEYLDYINQSMKELNEDCYLEHHHILPRCLDKEGKYSKEVAKINGANHFKAHVLLTSCFNGNKHYKLSYALTKMLTPTIKKCISSEDYELARELNREALCNREVSQLTRDLLRNQKLGNKSNTGKIWITNGEVNYMIPCTDEIPEGFWRGHLPDSEETRRKKSEASKGHHSNRGQVWINNGLKSKMIPNDQIIPSGWYKGMLVDASSRAQGNTNVRGYIWITDGVNSKRVSPEDFKIIYQPQGWIKGRGK